MNDMIRQQAWQPKDYAANARFVSDLAGAVLEWLDPKAGEHILDLGCGDGALTLKLSEIGAHVVGVDASENFVEAAKEQGVDARLMNGEALQFSQEFDAVFSNAALHWMTNPRAVVEGVARALRPGGRFVAEFGGFGNVAAIATALRAVAMVRGGDEALAGRVRRVDPSGYRKVSALGIEEQRVNVVMDLMDPPARRASLGHGYRVNVRVVVWQGEDVLTVPLTALFRNGEHWAVFADEDGTATIRHVTIGHTQGLAVEVRSGLDAGDRVVRHPNDRLADGTRIRYR